MTDLNRERRRKMIFRIKALRAKRVDAGATVDEAASAAEMAARIMAEHEIGEEAIEAAAYDRNTIKIRGVGLTPQKSHPVVYVAAGVAHITGCAVYTSANGFVVIGDEVGREMAAYLFDMARNVMDAAWAVEKSRRIKIASSLWSEKMHEPLPQTAHSSKAIQDVFRGFGCAWDRVTRRSFLGAMAERISTRMKEMPPARRTPESAVKEALRDSKEHRGKSRAKTRYDRTAIASGDQAGRAVAIGLGVGAMTEPTRMLESEEQS